MKSLHGPGPGPGHRPAHIYIYIYTDIHLMKSSHGPRPGPGPRCGPVVGKSPVTSAHGMSPHETTLDDFS